MARFFLSLRVRLAASPFAIVFQLVLANPLYVAVGPIAKLTLAVPDRFRRLYLPIRQPALKSYAIDSYLACNFFRRHARHMLLACSIFLLTRQPLCGKLLMD